MWELLAFEYVKTSVDKEHQFRKIKSMQHLLVALQQEKSSCYSILIFAVSLFGCHFALDARGSRHVPPPPLHATEYGVLLSERLNHVWASQAKLNRYEIEKWMKRIMTTQRFCNNLLFTTQLFKIEQIYTLLYSFTLFILDSWMFSVINNS